MTIKELRKAINKLPNDMRVRIDTEGYNVDVIECNKDVYYHGSIHNKEDIFVIRGF